MQFNIGDRVRVVCTDENHLSEDHKYIGMVGTVEETPEDEDDNRYEVRLDGLGELYEFFEYQLENAPETWICT